MMEISRRAYNCCIVTMTIFMVIGRGINTFNRAFIHNGGTVLAFQREVSYVRRRIEFPSNSWSLASLPPSHTEEEENKILTNQELVERRLEVNRGKRQARERNVQERVSRHLNIKRLLHSESNDGNITSSSKSRTTPFEVPPLYAAKVFVDEELRQELKLSGREKRGRVFIEANSEGTKTFRGLKDEMFGFFRALRKNSFLLTANLPQVDENGTIVAVVTSTTTDEDIFNDLHWKIENDEDVVKTFALANEYFQNSTSSTLSTMKRPSVQINVGKNPNAPLPLPPPAYLNGMPDPAESASMTMLSFYAFPPSTVSDVEKFAFNLRKIWKPFQALGRVYVATEGVNAQMSVPTNVLSHFMECCRSVPELGRYMENDINIDSKPLSQEEFAVAGAPHNGQPAPPFRNLHVRVRNQVVADGLGTSLDWQSAGYDMPPLEWHERLMQAREQTLEQKEKVDGDNEAINIDGKDLPILLDCRNNYETDVGIFEGAEALGTESFRDSWDVLKERLADTPKDSPIMAYCTGGIRCEFIYYRHCVLVLHLFVKIIFVKANVS